MRDSRNRPRRRYRDEKKIDKIRYAFGVLLDILRTIFRKNKKSYVRKTKGLHKRLKFIFGSIIAMFTILCLWLVGIISLGGSTYSKAALKNLHINSVDLIPKRGEILDRNGVVLAKSEKAYYLILDSVKLREEEAIEKKNRIKGGEDTTSPTVVGRTFDFLSKNFKISKNELENVYQEQLKEHEEAKRKKNNSVGLYYRLMKVSGKDYKKLEDKQKEPKTDITKTNVYGESFYTRVYPYKDVAGNLIGFLNKEDIPQTGIEMSYEKVLAGRKGRNVQYYDEVEGKKTKSIASEDGNNVVLTLDIAIQNLITNQIKEYTKKNKVKDMSILVMDPSNGDVLGMAATPFFDLNEPYKMDDVKIPDKVEIVNGVKTVKKRKLEDLTADERLKLLLDKWSNYTVSESIEPGSTFKPITLAAGLELKKFGLDTKYYCDGGKKFPGAYVYCVERKGHGSLTAAQAIEVSCNDALMTMAESIGPKEFLHYQSLFNLTNKTNIDLPYESRPQTYAFKKNFSALDLATNSFGQNFNVNMVQLAAANAAIGNNGNYFRPRVAMEIRDNQNYVKEKIDPVLERRVISEDVARDAKLAMRMVIEEGYIRKWGLIDGFSGQLFGKTGTSEKIPRKENKFISSFIEMAPFDEPKVLIYVVIDEPANSTLGTVNATKVGSELMRDILPLLRISPVDNQKKDEK